MFSALQGLGDNKYFFSHHLGIHKYPEFDVSKYFYERTSPSEKWISLEFRKASNLFKQLKLS